MIAQSQSGTGKTAAFVLAMLSRTNVSKNYPHIICLSPTYELAIQTGEVLKKMATFMPEIKVRYAVRGEEGIKSQLLIYFTYYSFVFKFLSQTRCPTDRSHSDWNPRQAFGLGHKIPLLRFVKGRGICPRRS